MAANQVESLKLVHGYTRDNFLKLSPKYNLFSIVPIEIYCMIELYKRYACDDNWDAEQSSKDITITQNPDKYIIKMNCNHDSTAFGQKIISLEKGNYIYTN